MPNLSYAECGAENVGTTKEINTALKPKTKEGNRPNSLYGNVGDYTGWNRSSNNLRRVGLYIVCVPTLIDRCSNYFHKGCSSASLSVLFCILVHLYRVAQ